MSRRPPETLADYLTAAIAPALIMTLVGSLVFFLVGVFYQGEYPLRLTWVLGLFVLAIVCVSRISMEEGASYAMLFGLPLALVVGLAVAKFVEIQGPLAPFSLPINWGLMALTWWCAHKLTWDCTLNDERRDTSGQGLLRSMGWDRLRLPGAQQSESSEAEPAQAPAPVPALEQPPPHLWWKRRLGGARPPAAHGKWVVYFSVAALPLFGLGQAFLPVDDTAGRRFAYWMLIIYVASALGLLLTTSFLGLRRYIHQRRLEMPLEMTAVWLGLGAAMIVGLLIVASLLPRPAAEYSLSRSLSAKLGKFASASRSSSEIALGPEGTKDPQSQNAAPPSKEQASDSTGERAEANDGQPKSPQPGSTGDDLQPKGADGQQQGEGKSDTAEQQQHAGQQQGEKQSEQRGAGNPAQQETDKSEQRADKGQQQTEKGGQQADKSDAQRFSNQASGSKEESSKEQSGGEKSGREAGSSSGDRAQQPRSTPPSSSQPNVGAAMASFVQALRWLIYAALAILAAWLGWKYREQLRAAWLQLLREWRDLWNSLFKRSAATADATSAAAASLKRLPRFDDFADPFLNGLARTTPLPQLVGYTFAALEAWSRDNAAPRPPEQTPLEYADSLASAAPQLGEPARQLIDIYSRLAYARQAPPAGTMTVLHNLWQAMRAAVKPLAAVQEA